MEFEDWLGKLFIYGRMITGGITDWLKSYLPQFGAVVEENLRDDTTPNPNITTKF